MKNDLIKTELALHFNPFGGLQKEELQEAIVSDFDFESIVQLVDAKQPIIIQLVGKKGRGKTLHLQLLGQLLKSYPVFLLNNAAPFQQMIQTPQEVMLVDSIHHLNILQRLQLYQKKKIIILTTHRSKAWEYRLAGKASLSYSFHGIRKEKLIEIIKKRILIASKHPNHQIVVDESRVEELIRKYGDDYRAILNHLYDVYQSVSATSANLPT